LSDVPDIILVVERAEGLDPAFLPDFHSNVLRLRMYIEHHPVSSQ
jgi:hypothetical protein